MSLIDIFDRCVYDIVFFYCSLRADSRTDSLVDMIKKQQLKTSELAQIYRDQKQNN